MAATLLPTGGIALVGAPDRDIGTKEPRISSMQAMQIGIAQDLVDELLESVKIGKVPQIYFGKAPQLRFGDRSFTLESSAESHRRELYRSSESGSDDELEFAGLINHSLSVQKVEHVTAGVDSALQQLRSNMAALSELKEANKTIVGDSTPVRTPTYGSHRRLPSTSFKANHLAPSKLGSPLLTAPPSPMHKRPPTSQPSGTRDAVVAALRVPVIHLLARQPTTEASLAETCCTSLASMRELLPKIAKKSSSATDKWQLNDKAFREINPYSFPYQTSEDRKQAIDGAIKSFDRQRLAKDDKLWQVLLPREKRGQGLCLSCSKVKPVEAKVSTPVHRISDLTKKKPATAKKMEDKIVEKKTKIAKEPEIKIRALVKEKAPRPVVKQDPVKAPPSATNTPAPRPTAPANRYTPSNNDSKIRTKKAPAADGTSAPRAKSMKPTRDPQRDRPNRPARPVMPVNTKPKNPSPLSASPPLNASDFHDSHPVRKSFAAGPSPVKMSNGNSDRSLKRKANDIDSDIHNHNLAVKRPHLDRSTPDHTPSHTNGRLNGSTPSSTTSVKRKSDESSSSTTPSAPKIRRVANIDVGLASRYHHNNPQASPGASSASTTSPTVPSLSFRQTVELSQRFQKYYKKYEELYWQLTESERAPTEAQRNDLLMMHKKLEEMKREIKAGAGVHR